MHHLQNIIVPEHVHTPIYSRFTTGGSGPLSLTVLKTRSHLTDIPGRVVSGTIIRGTLKAPNSQLVTPISTKLQRPDGCD
jgi:hypothetical protein